MQSITEAIKTLSHGFISKHYPDENEMFEQIWELVPSQLVDRQAHIQKEVESGFWDQITQSPYITDVVINIISAIIFELGIYAGRKVMGLTREKQKKEEFEKRWGKKTNNQKLVSIVIVYVYNNFQEAEESSPETDDKSQPHGES